jgi:hypothetical protein
MSNAKKAQVRAPKVTKLSAAIERVYFGFHSASEAAKATVSAELRALGGIRASACFAVWGDTPTKEDYAGKSDAASRVSQLEGIAAKMSRSSDQAKQDMVDALMSAKVTTLQEFADIVHYSVVKDADNKEWKTGKGESRQLTDNVGAASKAKIGKAVGRVTAKKANKASGNKQPQAKSTQPTETPAEVENTNKRKWHTLLNGLTMLAGAAQWPDGGLSDKARESFGTQIKLLAKLGDYIQD